MLVDGDERARRDPLQLVDEAVGPAPVDGAVPACVARFHIEDLRVTGSADTFMCHTLFGGKTAQVVPGTDRAAAGPGATTSDASTLAIPIHTAPALRILLVIGSGDRYG